MFRLYRHVKVTSMGLVTRVVGVLRRWGLDTHSSEIWVRPGCRRGLGTHHWALR